MPREHISWTRPPTTPPSIHIRRQICPILALLAHIKAPLDSNNIGARGESGFLADKLGRAGVKAVVLPSKSALRKLVSAPKD